MWALQATTLHRPATVPDPGQLFKTHQPKRYSSTRRLLGPMVWTL